ncbi:MAG: hypothetical protein AAF415_20370 [Pseudomonadota bacterium]
MSKIRFTGFANQSTVTLIARNDTITKGPLTISAWRQPVEGDIGEMDIAVLRASGALFAPEAVHFEADVKSATGLAPLQNGVNRDGTPNPNALYTVYDPQFHELEFVWDFGHTGTFSKLGRLPGPLQAKNFGHGKHATTVFETSGEKQVTCTAYRTSYADGTQTAVIVARKTISLTIADIDDVVPPAQRMYIGKPGESFDGIPAGARVMAMDRLADSGLPSDFINSGPARALFFKRGEFWEVDDSAQASISLAGGRNHYIGAWGPGTARAELLHSYTMSRQRGIFRTANGAGQLSATFHNIKLRGHWDVVNQRRATPGATYIGVEVRGPGHILAVNCEADGNDTNFRNTPNRDQSNTTDTSLTLWDCELGAFRDYGILTQDDNWGARVSVIGCRTRTHPNAASNFGLQGKGAYNAHGPFRASSGYRIYCVQNDFVSRQAWGILGAQPAFRLMVNAAQNTGNVPPQIICAYNMTEGCSDHITISIAGFNNPGGPNRVPAPLNALIKHNIMLGGWATVGGIKVAYGGVSVIENALILPDVATANLVFSDNSWTGVVEANDRRDMAVAFNPELGRETQAGLPSQGNATAPIRMIGNMVIERRAATQARGVVDFGDPAQTGFDGNFIGSVEARDNVIYRPNGIAPRDDLGAHDVALAIAPWMSQGPRLAAPAHPTPADHMTYDVANDGSNASFVATAGGLDLLAPTSGSPLAGAAAGAMSRTDILGRERPVSASAGAVEPV